VTAVADSSPLVILTKLGCLGFLMMRTVERERKLEGKPPLVQFLPRSNRSKKTPQKTERVHSNRKVNGSPTPASGVKNTEPEGAHV
jgi:hypothetical protein